MSLAALEVKLTPIINKMATKEGVEELKAIIVAQNKKIELLESHVAI
jgi:hypothetical protein